MKNVSETTTTNKEFKAEFKKLWDSSVIEYAKKKMREEREDFAKTNKMHDGQISQSGGYYIVVDNDKKERAIDEPFWFKDYITRKHTYEVFVKAMELGLENFSIDFQWDLRYWESLQDKFKGNDPENDGDGDCVNILTYKSDAQKEKDALTLNPYYVPSHIGQLFSYKAYSMLIALAKYSTNNYTKGRALFYLLDNGNLNYKRYVSKGEGGFMSAVLRGDLLLALRRADEGGYQALCKALTNREIEF